MVSAGGSTGGTDIIAAAINRYRNISPGKIVLSCDVIIIGSTYLLFHSVEKIVYGLTAMAIASFAIDMVLNGIQQSNQFFIISSEYEAIASRINNDIGRGVTVLDGHGHYSGERKAVIMVMVRQNEANKVLKVVKSIEEVKVKSVKKKMKDKGFAKAVSREDIKNGAIDLEIDLDEHIEFCIEAMKKRKDILGL